MNTSDETQRPCPLSRVCPWERIGILGTGAVGATYAYTLLNSGLARELVLVDINRERALGEAEDLSHCTPYGQQVDLIVGEITECRGAGLIVITAGVAQRSNETRLALVERNVEIFQKIIPQVVEVAPKAILLIVTNPVDAMTAVTIRISGLPAQQVLGSGTVLDSARLRTVMAAHCSIDARNLHGWVLGEHGDSEIIAWSCMTAGQVPIKAFCSERGIPFNKEVQDRIAHQVRQAAYTIIRRKGATQFAVATSLELITGAIVQDQNSILTVSSQMSGMYDLHGVCLSMPCLLNRMGIAGAVEVPLADEELRGLRQSAQVLRDVLREIHLD